MYVFGRTLGSLASVPNLLHRYYDGERLLDSRAGDAQRLHDDPPLAGGRIGDNHLLDVVPVIRVRGRVKSVRGNLSRLTVGTRWIQPPRVIVRLGWGKGSAHSRAGGDDQV